MKGRLNLNPYRLSNWIFVNKRCSICLCCEGTPVCVLFKRETFNGFCVFCMLSFQLCREDLSQRIWHGEGGGKGPAGVRRHEGEVKKILHEAVMGTGATRRVGKQQEVSFKVRPSYPFLPLPPRSGPLNTVNSWSYSCNAAHSKPRGAQLLQFASKLTLTL